MDIKINKTIIAILILFGTANASKGYFLKTNQALENLTENQGRKYSMIDKSDISINGLPIDGYTLDSLKTHLGEPDSTKEYDRIGMGEGLHTKYYYGKSNYGIESGGTNYYLEKIDFSSGIFEIKLRDFVLKKGTTINELKNIFPESYLNISALNEANSKCDKRMRVLLMCGGEYCDSDLLLEFKNDKIINFIYFIEWT